MQNLLKRRLAPLFGIIAIVAVMGFIMIGCGEVDPEEALDEFPNPTVEAWEYGNYTDRPLTAVYKGKTEVTYSWYKLGDTDAIPNETDKTYIPTTAGTYYVRVTEKTGLNKKYKNSGNVAVAAAPEYIDYLGKWLMKGVDNKWEPDVGLTDAYDEIITLYADKFRLDGTYDNEYLYFTINAGGWTKLNSAAITNVTTSGTPSTVGQQANTIPTMTVSYAEGWSLSLSQGETKGYSTAKDYTSMNLYKLSTSTGPAQMRRNAGGTNSTVINRIYIKQAD